MDRFWKIMITRFLGVFLLIGAFLLSKDPANLLGGLFVAIGLISTGISLVLSIYDSHMKREGLSYTGEEYLRRVAKDGFLSREDKKKEKELLRFVRDRAGEGLASMKDQKRLLPDLIRVLPVLRELTSSPAFERVEKGELSDAHGVGELIRRADEILRRADVFKYYRKWQSADAKTLLNAFTLLDFYLFPVVGEARGLRPARNLMLRVLLDRFPEIQTAERQRRQALTDAELHKTCADCAGTFDAEEMLLVDSAWLCRACFRKRFPPQTEENDPSELTP